MKTERVVTVDAAIGLETAGLQKIYRRVGLRLIPFLMVLYLIAFLDRVNISFAALTMNRDLHISETVFGVGAGIFFAGYFLFEVPSNLMLAKVGARRWIAFLMAIWGLFSIGMAFVHSGTSYVLVRFLLGAAEAGFFPGVVLYLTYWLPVAVRGRLMAMFIVAIPMSTVVGAPVSVAILGMNGHGGLKGWQWLFLIDGALAILFGAMVPWVLADRPEKASWLSHEEQYSLQNAIAKDTPTDVHSVSWLDLLNQRMVLTFCCVYFTLMIGLYALGFWIPQMLRSAGVSQDRIGWITAIPYAFSTVCMIFWSRHSDRHGERRWHLMAAFACAAVGITVAATTAHMAAISIAGFALAAAGIFSAMPLFWAMTTTSLSGGKAVAGVALINSIGNIGGAVGPIFMGWMLDRTHSFRVGLFAVSVILAAGTCLVWMIDQRGARSAGEVDQSG